MVILPSSEAFKRSGIKACVCCTNQRTILPKTRYPLRGRIAMEKYTLTGKYCQKKSRWEGTTKHNYLMYCLLT